MGDKSPKNKQKGQQQKDKAKDQAKVKADQARAAKVVPKDKK